MDDIKKRRVLIIEDHEDVAAVMMSIVEMLGYTAARGRNIADAMTQTSAESFDAVLTDYSLPDGTALDLLPRLKITRPRMPVILLTAHSRDFLPLEAQSGFASYLQKPIEVDLLRTTLQDAVG